MDGIETPTSSLTFGSGSTAGANPCVLVMGPEGQALRSLCSAVHRASQSSALKGTKVERCTHLGVSHSERRHVDFVVFLVDLHDSRSLADVEASLSLLDLHYQFGRCCFVVTGWAEEVKQSVTYESLRKLSIIECPVLCGNCEETVSCNSLGQKLVRLMEMVCSSTGPLMQTLCLPPVFM